MILSFLSRFYANINISEQSNVNCFGVIVAFQLCTKNYKKFKKKKKKKPSILGQIYLTITGKKKFLTKPAYRDFD